MSHEHRYEIRTTWTGNQGEGTRDYRAYARDHEIAAALKGAPIPGSSDPAFRGNATRYNPEELLVASLSACHMLWFLHFCAEAKIVVTAYTDDAVGTMRENADGSGEFARVVLRPDVSITEPARAAEIDAIHHRAHRFCFIARSVNFPVDCEGTVADA